jgi:hypothetical protein
MGHVHVAVHFNENNEANDDERSPNRSEDVASLQCVFKVKVLSMRKR